MQHEHECNEIYMHLDFFVETLFQFSIVLFWCKIVVEIIYTQGAQNINKSLISGNFLNTAIIFFIHHLRLDEIPEIQKII